MNEPPTTKLVTSRFRHTQELHDRIEKYAKGQGITLNAALNVLVRAALPAETQELAQGAGQ
jgi:hypothetical protein